MANNLFSLWTIDQLVLQVGQGWPWRHMTLRGEAWILLMTEITWLAGHPLDHQRFLLAEDWEEQTGLAKRLREAYSDKTNIYGLREAEDGRVESSEGSGGMVVTGHAELDLLHFFLPSLSLFLKCSGLALWGVLSTTLLLTSSLKFLCAWSTDVIRQGLTLRLSTKCTALGFRADSSRLSNSDDSGR